MLRKEFYPNEYIDSWERFNKELFPDKNEFYSSLNIKDITDQDYAHAKRVSKDFKLNILGDYHDLYVQGDHLLLTDVFENFRNKHVLKYINLILLTFCQHQGYYDKDA